MFEYQASYTLPFDWHDAKVEPDGREEEGEEKEEE